MVALKQYDAAVPLLTSALARVSNDRETAYYLAIAQQALGRTRAATVNWETGAAVRAAPRGRAVQSGSRASRGGAQDEALGLLGRAIEAEPDGVRAGAMEVALLRASGRTRRGARGAWRTGGRLTR